MTYLHLAPNPGPPFWLQAAVASWVPWPGTDMVERGRAVRPAAVSAYRTYRERCRGWTLTDRAVLPKVWAAAHLASWLPAVPPRWQRQQMLHALVVLKTDGTLAAVGEATPSPVERDRAFALLRHVLKRDGVKHAGGEVPTLLLPSALRAYTRAVGHEAAGAATAFEDSDRPATANTEAEVARLEYRRLAADMRPFLRLLDPEIVAVLIRSQATDIRDYALYQAPATRLRRLQAARAFPLLATTILRTPELLNAVDRGLPLTEALAVYYGVTGKLMQRLVGQTWRDIPLKAPDVPDGAALEALVHDLAALTPGTLPKGRRGWVALLALRAASGKHRLNVANRADAKPLFVQAQPKWADTAGRMLVEALGDRAPGPGDAATVMRLASLVADANDIVRAVHRSILLPVAMLVVAERDGVDLAEARARLEARPEAALALAAEMAFGTLTPPKIIRRSHECHQHPELFQAFGRGLSWKPLIAPRSAPNGVLIQALTSSGDLKEEGQAMHHCVGGYDWACAYDGRHILSLRSTDGERLSTVEIARPMKPRAFAVRQHRAPHNARPDAAAEAALSWLRESVEAGEIEINLPMLEAALGQRIEARRRMEQSGHGEDPLAIIAPAFTLWRPYLEKPWSKMGVMDVVAETARRALAWTRESVQ